YPDGNIYHALTEFNFNGTPPANGRGERDQVGGSPDRDGGMALYGPDPPGVIVTNRTDGTSWPPTPVHTTTGSSYLTADFNTAVALNPVQAITQTFTPDSTFKLDKFMIRASGAATTGELSLYQAPGGGTEGTGYVSFAGATSLISSVPFTFDGSA